MLIIELIGNFLNLVALVILLDSQPFRDLNAFLKKEIDLYGSVPVCRKGAVFNQKIRIPLSVAILLMGNVLIFASNLAEFFG